MFDGLGFKVTLTPGSRDGGKDVILECEFAGKQATYYVEIMHWRSSARVGADAVEKLLKVIVREEKAGSFFLSTASPKCVRAVDDDRPTKAAIWRSGQDRHALPHQCEGKGRDLVPRGI
ncbi:restriction endonuclease [Sinorhizobium medicae]|uniref:restriction endonuclease n=1 Tax=Sinorhizobium medicae TaxID=110321 RepID=UPI001F321AAB|nr:restriction endonuclease [Sinorhizobium medicae]UWU12250.1 restriction endonuclease [Sinorhizobium medicae]